MIEEKLRTLFTLLDDPDESIAVSVMSELLKYESELLPLLGEMQESADPVMRKRIQQLESILNLRSRRKAFLSHIDGSNMDLVQGLIELHLLWFDRDNPEMLMDLIRTFVRVAANNNIKNIAELGSFMARNNFALPPVEEEMDPENYCIGPIMEDRLGSDIMLCTLALIAGIDAGLELGLVRIAGHFFVVNSSGEMISPANDWLVDNSSKLERGEFWNDPSAILRYASLMLFLFAVSSDNFRYVHTIAHALIGSEGNEVMDFLPYPYNGSAAEK